MINSREKILQEFPVLNKVLYFNTASIGIAPDSTIKAIENFIRRYQDESICDDAKSFQIIDHCKSQIAQLIGSSIDEIALLPNTSFGINIVSHGLPFQKGDEILIPDGEFPANVLPWKTLAKKGITINIIDRIYPLLDSLKKAITPRTRAIAISAISFSDGYVIDLAALSELCHKNNIFLAVDAIQAIGNFPIDVSELGIGLMASGAQKWQLTPWGAGFLYVSKEFQNILDVNFEGWLSRFPERDFSNLLNYEIPYPDSALKYECGSPVFPSLAGYENSLRILLKTGVAKIHGNSLEIADYIIERASKYQDWEIISPIDGKNRSAIVSIKMTEANELFQFLRKRNVILSIREGALRFAFHLYNMAEDVDRLFELVDQFYEDK
ncbi:MAG: aminotransferase class V-fold PLP-dependent enzyme [Candidatus Zixiibacteriota bacterium]